MDDTLLNKENGSTPSGRMGIHLHVSVVCDSVSTYDRLSKVFQSNHPQIMMQVIDKMLPFWLMYMGYMTFLDSMYHL